MECQVVVEKTGGCKIKSRTYLPTIADCRLTSTVCWAYHNIKLLTECKLKTWRFLIKEDAPEMSRRQPKPIRTETGNWVDRWKSRTLRFHQFFAPEFFFSIETNFSNDANEIHFCSATCLKSCKRFFSGLPSTIIPFTWQIGKSLWLP